MSAAHGLTNASQCEPCAASFYCSDEATTVATKGCWPGYVCRGGDVYPSEKCPVGHFCAGNNSVPEPCAAGMYQNVTGQSECMACPAGAYCGLATVQPHLCPVSTYSIDPGAVECTACPSGFFCKDQGTIDFTNFICPPGTYCPEATDELVLCPAGTYRNETGGSKLAQCLETPGGYYSEEGAKLPRYCSDPAKHVGYFCPAGSGNMTICPPGAYCPWAPPSADVTACPESYYCPQGSLAPTLCFNGTYCPAESEIYRWCPLGYRGAPDSNNTYGSIADACEECPAGKYGASPDRLSCDRCTPGYVCLGATTSATPASRATDNGYECPAGHYCPIGSSTELPCPKVNSNLNTGPVSLGARGSYRKIHSLAHTHPLQWHQGHYNPNTGASNVSSCLPCNPGDYQNVAGSATCKSCSTSSTSIDPGATVCTCLGLNRGFQPSDGYCTCDPGFEFYDENYNVQTGDGEVDCQPVVYERCSDSQVRDQTGDCVDSGDCSSQCGDDGGTYISSIGSCECNNLDTLDEVCDADCRAESSYITANGDGTLSVCDSTGNCTDVDTADIDGFRGAISCASDDCSTVSMDSTSGGIEGVYGLSSSIGTEARRRRQLQATGGDSDHAQTAWRQERRQRRRRRHLSAMGWFPDENGDFEFGNSTITRSLTANSSRRTEEIIDDDAADDDESSVATILNPVVCINEGACAFYTQSKSCRLICLHHAFFTLFQVTPLSLTLAMTIIRRMPKTHC